MAEDYDGVDLDKLVDDVLNEDKSLFVMDKGAYKDYQFIVNGARSLASDCDGDLIIEPLKPQMMAGDAEIVLDYTEWEGSQKLLFIEMCKRSDSIEISATNDGRAAVNFVVKGLFERKVNRS